MRHYAGLFESINAGKRSIVLDLKDDAGRDRALALADQAPELITADLTGTTFCDSAGVHALTRAHQGAVARGGELRLAVGDSPVARILELTGLDQIIPVFRGVRQSLDTPREAAGSPP